MASCPTTGKSDEPELVSRSDVNTWYSEEETHDKKVMFERCVRPRNSVTFPSILPPQWFLKPTFSLDRTSLNNTIILDTPEDHLPVLLLILPDICSFLHPGVGQGWISWFLDWFLDHDLLFVVYRGGLGGYQVCKILKDFLFYLFYYLLFYEVMGIIVFFSLFENILLIEVCLENVTLVEAKRHDRIGLCKIYNKLYHFIDSDRMLKHI